MAFSVPQERKLVTELPGPRSRALQERRVASVSRGAGTLANIYMDHGSGAILVDVDGNQLIDFGCGIGVTTIGHANTEVAEAAYAQAQKLTHTLFTVTPYENYVRVAEKLAEVTPGDFEKHSILVNSGAEAVENAVKIARRYTGRRAIVALDHAFHGRTNLTMTMTYRPWPERAGMGPFPGEIYSVPVSYPFRDGLSGDEAAARTIDYIETHIGASEVAAFFAEPVQGDGGVNIPAPGYFAAIKDYCSANGIVFVADEIQAGFARTGAWFSIEHHGVVPDLVTSAKGIAGGFPLAAVTGRAEIMDAVRARRHRRAPSGVNPGRPPRPRSRSSRSSNATTSSLRQGGSSARSVPASATGRNGLNRSVKCAVSEPCSASRSSLLGAASPTPLASRRSSRTRRFTASSRLTPVAGIPSSASCRAS